MPDSASSYGQLALEYYLEINDRHNAARASFLLARNDVLQGNLENVPDTFNSIGRTFLHYNDMEGAALSTLEVGDYFYNRGEYHKALKYFLETLAISKKNDLKFIEIQSLTYVGKYYHSVGNFRKSLDYYEGAYRLAKYHRDSLGLVRVMNKIGKHYETLGNYPEALEYCLKAEMLHKGVKNNIEIANTYNHLGNIYHLLHHYEKAIFFHKRALAKRKQTGYREGVAKSLNNLGEVLIEKNLIDSATRCFSDSYLICYYLQYKKGMIKCILNQGIINNLKDSFAVAADNFAMAIHLSDTIRYNKGFIEACYQLALLYKKMNRLKLSINYAKKGLHMAADKDVKSAIRDYNFLLSELYENAGNQEKALKYYKSYHAVNDEIVNLKSNEKIAELESRYKNSLQQRENAVLKKENEIQELMIERKNGWIFFISITLGMLVIIVFVTYNKYLQNQRVNMRLALMNEKIRRQNSELDSLNNELHKKNKQQVKLFSIISHELRNPLYWFRNLIQMLDDRIDDLDKGMIRKSIATLNESATNTYHLMDNLLQWSKSQLGNILIKQETLNLDTIIRENINQVKPITNHKQIKIHYNSISIENEYIKGDKHMIQTVVRNILSNAVKFTPEKGLIRIIPKKQRNKVLLEIKDTGGGIEPDIINRVLDSGKQGGGSESLEVDSGLGLLLCREFVERNNGQFNIESKKGEGTSVFITFLSN